MANANGGGASFSAGTGAQSIGLGASGYNGVKLTLKHPNYKPFEGWVYSSGSQSNFSDVNIALDTTKMVKIRNSSGTVVIEGTASISGSNLNVNLSSNVASPPNMQLDCWS